MNTISIRLIQQMDTPLWRSLRREHWPDFSEEDNSEHVNRFLSDSERAGFLALDEKEQPLGYLEAHIRFLAESCLIQPIGYVEDWYVKPSVQRRGIGKQLMAAAEVWFRANNCREMASDVQTGDESSYKASLAVGFREGVHRVHLEKPLTEGQAGQHPV